MGAKGITDPQYDTVDPEEVREMTEDVKTETCSPMAQLAAAIVKAQADMKNAPLNKENPHFRSKFADLAAIRDATIPCLTKHGLSIIQHTRMAGDRLFLYTRLMHESGEYLESEYPLPMHMDKPQQMGSAITYAKRYCWSAMCGIAAEEDDDANAAQGEKEDRIDPNPPELKEKGSHPMDWPKGWNKTKLQGEIRTLVSMLEVVETPEALDSVLDEYAQVIELCEKHLPSWWNERSEAHPEFIPLEERIERTRNFDKRDIDAGDPRPDLPASLEISPKGPGGWQRWDAAIREAIQNAEDIEGLGQLQMDNAKHIQAYSENSELPAQAIMQKFSERAAELSQAPLEGEK